MRVISQTHDTDIDYARSIFEIRRHGTMYVIHAYCAGMKFEMGIYGDENEAKDALMGLSKAYTPLLITCPNKNYSQVSDCVICEQDTPFEPITIQPMDFNTYVFPPYKGENNEQSTEKSEAEASSS